MYYPLTNVKLTFALGIVESPESCIPPPPHVLVFADYHPARVRAAVDCPVYVQAGSERLVQVQEAVDRLD